MAEKHLKKCSKSLVIREIQIKMTLRFYLTPIKMVRSYTQEPACAGKDVEKEKHSSIAGGIASWYNYSHWKSICRFLRKLEIVLPEDPAMPFLGIYTKDAPSYQRDTCSMVFIDSSLICNSQKLETTQIDVPQWKNRYRKCGTFTQWKTTQILSMRTS